MTLPPDMMAKLDAEHAANLARLTREYEMKTAVLAATGLPASVWTAGAVHAYRADCFLRLHADTLSDAILIAERANPETRVKSVKGGTSFVALDSLASAQAESAEIVNPYTYHISGLKEYTEEKDIRFTVMVAGYRVEYRVRVANDPDTRRIWHPNLYKRGRLVKPAWTELVNRSGHFTESTRFWSTPDQPNTFVLH